MGMFLNENPWAFTLGLIGNISCLGVFLAPLPTFFKVVKMKSTEGFQSIPCLAALFSSLIWIYASVKPDTLLLITINSFGCVIDTIYIAIYIIYSPKQSRMQTLILVLINFGVFCTALFLSQFFASGSNRVQVLGWFCVVFCVTVFAAPLII
ncbi:LOW QUALITY PROTEIN: MtN3_slv domain-containing protein, partial [Cephalotus follicularis]